MITSRNVTARQLQTMLTSEGTSEVVGPDPISTFHTHLHEALFALSSDTFQREYFGRLQKNRSTEEQVLNPIWSSELYFGNEQQFVVLYERIVSYSDDFVMNELIRSSPISRKFANNHHSLC